jgi:EmrB/QacA subfamily drug resistance transporter
MAGMSQEFSLPGSAVSSGARRRRGFAFAAVCTLLFLTFLDNTIVSVALGDIQEATHAGVQSLQWVVNAYALVFASMMLVAGTLGDRLGQRRVMLAGAAIFAAGSVVCALATTSGVLIGGRAVMGLGAAGSEPATLAMLRHLYPGRRERARATGLWAAVCGLALAMGPVIGGLIVGVSSWHWIFWFNLIFGMAAFLTAAGFVPETLRTPRPVDLPGALLGTGALATLVFGVIDGESAGYRAGGVVTLFACAAVLAVGFVVRMQRARDPLIDLRGSDVPGFTASNVVALCSYFGTFALFFFCALYLRVVVGDSGLHVAAEFVPMMVAMIVGSLVSGRWTARTGPRLPIVLGSVVFAVGLLLADGAVTPHPSDAAVTLALMVAGAGIGVAVVPTAFAGVGSVPVARAGMASSAVNTSREVGAVAGTAVLGAIVNGSLISHLTAQLDKLGVPTLKNLVIPEVLHGGAALVRPGAGGGLTGASPLADKLLDSVYGAFSSGLHVCLVVSAIVVSIGGATAFVTLRHQDAVAREAHAEEHAVASRG